MRSRIHTSFFSFPSYHYYGAFSIGVNKLRHYHFKTEFIGPPSFRRGLLLQYIFRQCKVQSVHQKEAIKTPTFSN